MHGSGRGVFCRISTTGQSATACRRKVFAGHKPELLENIREWAKSEHIYTCRFGLEMLMTHFLDDDFKPEYLELAADVKLEDYYAKMMVAWFFATALAKQWDAAIVYLQQNRRAVDA